MVIGPGVTEPQVLTCACEIHRLLVAGLYGSLDAPSVDVGIPVFAHAVPAEAIMTEDRCPFRVRASGHVMRQDSVELRCWKRRY